MKPSTVDMLRACLLAASLAARSALRVSVRCSRDTPCQTVSMSADCALRLLVVFHLTLNRARVAFAP